MLAVARAAGETAPLLLADSIFNASHYSLNIGEAVPNIPDDDLLALRRSYPAGFARAWGAGFVLLAFIVLASLGARMLLARSRAKLTS